MQILITVDDKWYTIERKVKMYGSYLHVKIGAEFRAILTSPITGVQARPLVLTKLPRGAQEV